MKLMNYRTDGNMKLGISTDRGVLDVEFAGKRLAPGLELPATASEVVAGGLQAISALKDITNRALSSNNSEWWLDEAKLQIGPCVNAPGKIICVGLNYRQHAIESNMDIPKYPILFNKFANTLAGSGEEIPLPPGSDMVDYEAELAIVIGRRAKAVNRNEALDYVFGYCNANDLSARDFQLRTSQWMLGKSCDKFAPLGPYLVTFDEVGDPNALDIACRLNGETRQSSHTSDMIFPCDEIVSYISQHITLEPGDIILTGTPEGVIMGYPEDRRIYLQDGDVVTVEIAKLGVLTNRLIGKPSTNK
ncbi:fumarylacetoacetate hydrolase family protein [Cohnella sp. REN36]|uniref:fumarylacetoacetate hydrolase family protein n=1 Tax=Cohnella sp. REN36 TaxID=2887347 RepID=UPI001D13EF52|nr:fumarylacetoacetate hydrolase family protein [Cohnella sp. REN36]MCC3374443.1 fumarylacetoacetate hydrolase family protein [Cohnella sp. REN36]